jgi:hypothetical protein
MIKKINENKESQETIATRNQKEVCPAGSPRVATEADDTLAGTGCAGRTGPEPGTGREKTSPHRRQQKKKKTGTGTRKNPARKKHGKHVPKCMYEAMTILLKEGYIPGKVQDQESVFDIVALGRRGSLLLRVVRPKEPVANARDVRELYEDEIRRLEPYYRSDGDDIQFWVFSRKNKLIRYRVYDWGIGNVETMQKIMKNTRG